MTTSREAIEKLTVLIDTKTEPGPWSPVWASADDWVRWGEEVVIGLGIDYPGATDIGREFISDVVWEYSNEGQETVAIATLIIDSLLTQ